MATMIRADLGAINREGLVKAHLQLLEDAAKDRPLLPGDGLIVADLFGIETFPARVVSIDGDAQTVLLDVSWDADEVLTGLTVSTGASGLTFGPGYNVEITEATLEAGTGISVGSLRGVLV